MTVGFRRFPAAAALALGLTAVVRDAGAEEGKAEDESSVVITGTRTREDAKKAVVRTDVVTSEEAKRRGATNVGEALAAGVETDVNASAHASIGGPSAARIGGLDRERVLVLEDGERVTGDVGGAVDLSQLSLAGVQRIEVVEGPSSALYGSSAIGGVINVISGPPEIEGWSGYAQAEGRYRYGAYAAGALAFRLDDSWASLDASMYASDAVRLSEDVPDPALPATRRNAISLRAGTRFAPGVTAQARVRYGYEASDGLETQSFPGLGSFLIDLPERTHRLAARVRTDMAWRGGHSLALTAGSQWFWNETARDRRESPADDVRDRYHTMRSFEAVGSLFQGRMVSGVAGARVESEQFEQNLARTLVSAEGLRTEELIEVVPTSLTSGAAYTELRWDPAESVTFLAGGRIEASDRYGVVPVPRLAVAIRHLDWLVLRVNGGRGFRAPSAKELGFVFDHSVYGYRVVGNTALEPETSWGVGGDVTIRTSRYLDLAFIAHVNWVDDLIDLRLSPAQGGAAGVDDYTYVNVGEATTATFRAQVRVKPVEGLRADVAYVNTYTRDEELQRPLPGRPPHTLLTTIVWQAPLGLTFVGRWKLSTSAYLEDALRAPGFSVLDLRVAKALWPGAETYASVLNLLGAQKDPERIGDQRPIEGRTFVVGVRAAHP